VDALTPNRDYESGQVINRVVAQFLVELDGGEQPKGVFVIGATNRKDAIDGSLIRPGRFGQELEVPLPSPYDRVKILKTLAKDRPIDSSVDLSVIGRMKECENFSGADLAALVCVCSLYFLILTVYFAYVRFCGQTLQNHIRVGQTWFDH
ncbi:cell division control protein 48 c-like, partial [Trifolium pratense]